MIIDACCHIGINGNNKSTVDDLLRKMDQCAIDQAVLHPPDCGFAWENEAANDLMIEATKQYPGRFIAVATVNPWRSDGWAVIEKYLDRGARVLSFSPGIQGFNVAEGKLDSILTNLVNQKRRIPVYIHTGHPSSGAPCQLAILAGRFPGLSFVMGHSGATDYWTDAIPVCKLCPNIWMESSLRLQGVVASLREVGCERGIFGSGYPYNDISFEISKMKQLLPEPYHRAVLGANLLKLLGNE